VPRLTRLQIILAILVILLLVVWPAMVSYWQGFSSETMVPALAKQLRSWGWDVSRPDWLAFITYPIGLILLIILVMQLFQQQKSAMPEGGGSVAENTPDQPHQQSSVSVGTNYGQVAGVNQGLMYQAVHLGPPKRSVAPDARAQMISILSEKPSKIAITATQNDAEAHQFRRMLAEIFREAGWEVNDEGWFMFFGATRGLKMVIPPDAPGPDDPGPAQTVAQAVIAGGHSLVWNRGQIAEEHGIYLQVWGAPDD
jgi:hypothetical protein